MIVNANVTIVHVYKKNLLYGFLKYLIRNASIPGYTKHINIPEKQPVIDAYYDTDVNNDDIAIGIIHNIKLNIKFFQNVSLIENKSTINIFNGNILIPPLTNNAIIKKLRPINIKLSEFPI